MNTVLKVSIGFGGSRLWQQSRPKNGLECCAAANMQVLDSQKKPEGTYRKQN
jgi:hypothetical protein